MTEKIIEKGSLFWDKVKEISELNVPVYLYGAGVAAKNVMVYLEKRGISVSGMVVDRDYYSAGLKKVGVFCLEDLLNCAEEKINLIQATAKYNKQVISKYKDKIEIFLKFDIFHPVHLSKDNIFMTYDWITYHEKELDWVYDSLADDMSKEIFVAYLNQRISGVSSYLSGKQGERQYFDEDVMPLNQMEVLIDCGAYNGDSAISFVEELHRRGIYDYKEIWSFEPDKDNFCQMRARDIPNHICIPKGVSDQCDVLSFASGKGVGSSIGDGETFVEVVNIDRALGGREATIIKMDIEGCEMKALMGAEYTLRVYKPKLAICIYHKDEDLYMIPRYIRSIVPEYRFFIRIYEEYVNEMVLYAIPAGSRQV